MISYVCLGICYKQNVEPNPKSTASLRTCRLACTAQTTLFVMSYYSDQVVAYLEIEKHVENVTWNDVNVKSHVNMGFNSI